MQITDADISTASLLTRTKGRGRSILTLLTSNPKIAFGVIVVACFLLAAIFAPILTPYDPNMYSKVLLKGPSSAHWLGTTNKGQDVLAQILYGARITLFIGLAAAIGSTLLQVLVGLTSGYFGGFVDDVLSVITNVFLVIPGLPLAIVLASFSPVRGPALLIPLLLLTTWSFGARVLRAQTLSMREREFVAAARASGETPWRIIFAEIMPNEIALVVSNFVTTMVYVILTDVALEFLGLGDTNQNSWGAMLYWAQGAQALLAGEWWWFLPTCICIALLCSGFAFINFGIDELANPRLRKEKTGKKRAQPKAQQPNLLEQQKDMVAQ